MCFKLNNYNVTLVSSKSLETAWMYNNCLQTDTVIIMHTHVKITGTKSGIVAFRYLYGPYIMPQ